MVEMEVMVVMVVVVEEEEEVVVEEADAVRDASCTSLVRLVSSQGWRSTEMSCPISQNSQDKKKREWGEGERV